MKSSARNAYLEKKVERITDRTVRALIYQIRKGDFEPEAFEVDVSTRIPLKDGEAVNLRGRIDRMDVFEDEDKIYVKIMDYRSRKNPLTWRFCTMGCSVSLWSTWTRR